MESIEDYKGTETILLVDDTEQVRMYLSDFLGSLGYKLIIAENGKEAVDKYRQHIDSIGAVVMDVIMPRKDGISAYLEMKEINPNAYILLFSGNTGENSGKASGLRIMQKPFSPLEIARKIRSMLDGIEDY